MSSNGGAPRLYRATIRENKSARPRLGFSSTGDPAARPIVHSLILLRLKKLSELLHLAL
jgi:hypothetical protein